SACCAGPRRRSTAFKVRAAHAAQRSKRCCAAYSAALRARLGRYSLDIEGGEEVVQRLALLEFGVLQQLDPLLEVLDVRLLLVELLQVALVRLRRLRHLPEVGPQPRLVVHDHLQLALLLLNVPLRRRQLGLQLDRLPQRLLDLLADDRLAEEEANGLV